MAKRGRHLAQIKDAAPRCARSRRVLPPHTLAFKHLPIHGRICSRKRPKARLYEVSVSTCLLKELPKKGKQAPGAPAAPRRSVEEKLTCDCLSCEPGESSLPLWSPLTVFFPPKEQLTHPGYSDTGTREMFLKSEQSEPGTVREATGSVGCQS